MKIFYIILSFLKPFSVTSDICFFHHGYEKRVSEYDEGQKDEIKSWKSGKTYRPAERGEGKSSDKSYSQKRQYAYQI